ncbi:flagellar protein FlgN [Thermomonas brevis]|uniref:Flagellar protein FlgN n=1 Tax=Thermomonas brevis TaxID=215691 RepID=A0A7G9QTQ6_9GAMM|nr:flagellar protein FlgN [Thermomonas brevis]QNN46731.1 flagellar protein FlgN [Thermomonas brevis]
MSLLAEHPLDALESALQAERRALLEHDVDALLRSTQAKLEALSAAERVAGSADMARVGELHELNRANAVLLARRRREVAWTLRHIGRTEASGVYDGSGYANARAQSRWLGSG